MNLERVALSQQSPAIEHLFERAAGRVIFVVLAVQRTRTDDVVEFLEPDVLEVAVPAAASLDDVPLDAEFLAKACALYYIILRDVVGEEGVRLAALTARWSRSLEATRPERHRGRHTRRNTSYLLLGKPRYRS